MWAYTAFALTGHSPNNTACILMEVGLEGRGQGLISLQQLRIYGVVKLMVISWNLWLIFIHNKSHSKLLNSLEVIWCSGRSDFQKVVPSLFSVLQDLSKNTYIRDCMDASNACWPIPILHKYSTWNTVALPHTSLVLHEVCYKSSLASGLASSFCSWTSAFQVTSIRPELVKRCWRSSPDSRWDISQKERDRPQTPPSHTALKPMHTHMAPIAI